MNGAPSSLAVLETARRMGLPCDVVHIHVNGEHMASVRVGVGERSGLVDWEMPSVVKDGDVLELRLEMAPGLTRRTWSGRVTNRKECT